MEPWRHSWYLVILQQSATAAVAVSCGGGCKRMCCSSIVICSYCQPEICRSLPSMYLSDYIECYQFGMSAVSPSSWLIGLTWCHHAPDVFVLCSWYTSFKKRRWHYDIILWPWQRQPASVCYLCTLILSADPFHLPWVMVRILNFWG